MKTLFLLLLTLLPSLLQAETKVFPKEGQAIAVLRSSEEKSQWSVIAIDFDKKRITPVIPTILEAGLTCIIEGAPGSQCAVMRYGPDGIQREALVVTLGSSTPIPPKPEDPNVPPPLPPPGTPLTGMRVLILEETSPSAALPKAQQEALRSPQVIAYLDSKATTRWRKLDPNVTVSNLPKPWQDLRAAIKTDTDQPQVAVAGLVGGVEKVIYSGPYPEDPVKALEFFKKYGGP